MLQAWKSSHDSQMYFIPMFDETDGYYDSAAGVSFPAFFPLSSQTDINVVVVLLG